LISASAPARNKTMGRIVRGSKSTEESRWVQPTNQEFSSMETYIGFQITKGLVAMGPAWLWIYVAAGISLLLGIILGMAI